MKTISTILILLLELSFFNSSINGQVEGESFEFSFGSKLSIDWPGNDDTTVFSLATKLKATITSNKPFELIELQTNGISERDFKIINAGTHYRVEINKEIDLNDGRNEIRIKAKNTKGKEVEKFKTIIAKTTPDKPLVEWTSPVAVQTSILDSVITLKAIVKSEVPLDSVKVYINDQLQRGFNVVKSDESNHNKTIKQKINLKTGMNSVYIVAGNRGGSIKSETRFIKRPKFEDQKRVALVVGNANYKSGNVLANPKNDANDIAAALKRLAFDVTLITDADHEPFSKAVDEFGDKAKGADIAFFYYAGHGVQVKGENYLIPVDAKIERENEVKFHCVNANLVLAHLEYAKSKVNVIVMDACRDNPFERSWQRSTKVRGLATMDAPIGTLIAYATQPGNTAADGTGSNGLYTNALLEYIEQGDLSLFEVFMKVRIKVLKDSEQLQQPWESSSLTQNVYLLK